MKSDMSRLTRRLEQALAPLEPAEEHQAIEAALAYVRRAAGEQAPRLRALGAELRIEKPTEPQAVLPRLVRVLVADYAGRRILDVTVDRRGKVTQSTELPGFQPPFHPEEMSEASEIARRDERVARLARRRGVFISTFVPPPEEAPGTRLVGLRYVSSRAAQPAQLLASVVVDLAELQLVAFQAAQPAHTEGG